LADLRIDRPLQSIQERSFFRSSCFWSEDDEEKEIKEIGYRIAEIFMSGKAHLDMIPNIPEERQPWLYRWDIGIDNQTIVQESSQT